LRDKRQTFEGEKFTSGTTDFGEDKLDAPARERERE